MDTKRVAKRKGGAAKLGAERRKLLFYFSIENHVVQFSNSATLQ